MEKYISSLSVAEVSHYSSTLEDNGDVIEVEQVRRFVLLSRLIT